VILSLFLLPRSEQQKQTFLFLSMPSDAEPRFLVAQPNYAERPIQFYWFDVETMGRLLQIDEEKNRPPPLVVAYNDDDDDDDDDDDNNNNSNSSASKPQQAPAAACYPRRPHLASLQEFKTSPAIHAAYALTWFSLSVLGTVMTRRLYLGRPGW
jgi:cytochrome oxidase assembly protein ShyY1